MRGGAPGDDKAQYRCTARRKNGTPCRGWAIRGSDKCNTHLFNPKAKAKAAVRAELMNWGLGDTTVDPGQVLLRLVTQSAVRAQRYAQELEALVDEHGLHDALVGKTLMVDANGNTHEVSEYVRGLAQIEAAERDRCCNFAAKAVAAGLMEKQVRLAEKQGALIADVLRAVLGDPSLGLTEAQRKAAPDAIRRHLAIAPAPA